MQRILIVDDGPEILSLMSLSFRMEGFEVTTATNGERGVQLAVANKPDIILMDIMMPGITGLEAARQLQENKDTNHIPITFVSARHELDDIIQGWSLASIMPLSLLLFWN